MDGLAVRQRLYAQSLYRIAAILERARALLPPDSEDARALAQLRSDVLDLYRKAS